MIFAENCCWNACFACVFIRRKSLKYFAIHIIPFNSCISVIITKSHWFSLSLSPCLSISLTPKFLINLRGWKICCVKQTLLDASDVDRSNWILLTLQFRWQMSMNSVNVCRLYTTILFLTFFCLTFYSFTEFFSFQFDSTSITLFVLPFDATH